VLQLLRELAIDPAQVSHVGQRVAQLLRLQRTGRPVGEARALVEFRLADLAHQRFVADLVAISADHGRHLGVEDRRRHLAGADEEDLEILAGGVEDLQDFLVRQQVVDRLQVEPVCQHVDAGRRPRVGVVAVGRRELDQAELRPVGLVADEFGIDADVRATAQRRAEFGELVIARDRVFQSVHIHGPRV
jgi:hypothetical protein